MTDDRREERETRAGESPSGSVEERLDRLESLVEAQQERVDEQERTIEDQQATIREQRERIADLEGGAGDDGLAVNRRDAMKAGGLLALVFGGSATASADPQGQIGTSGDPLRRLYTEEINGGITNDKALTNVEGAGLSISSGTLNASGASAWKETDSDGLLEPKGTNTGIEVTDVRTNTLSDNGSGQVTLGGSLDANGNVLSDISGGPLTLSGNGNGVSVSAGDNLDLGGDDVTNVGTLSGTSVNTDSLAPNTSGGSVTLGGPLDANGNTIQDTTGDLSLGATGNVVANATLDAQGGSVTNTTGSLTLSHEDAGNGTSLTLDAGSNDQSLRMTNLPALDNSFLTIDGSGTLGISSESVSSLDSRFVNESGDTMTGNLSMGSSSITDVAGIDGGGSAISVDDTLDANGNTITDAGTIDTRDNRNLTLDPGSNNGLTLKNVPSQESDILTLDSNGNVGVSATGSGYTGVRAYRGTDQGLGGATADTDVIVEFDTEAFDTDNNYDTSSFAYTVPSDGFYTIATQVMIVVQEDEDRVLKLQRNGSDVPGARARTYERENGTTVTLSLTADLQLTSGDSIQVVVRFLNRLDTAAESIRAGSNLTIRRVGS